MKEEVATCHAGITKGERASQGLRMEELAHPRWYGAQVLGATELQCQSPSGAQTAVGDCQAGWREQLCLGEQDGVRIPVSDNDATTVCRRF